MVQCSEQDLCAENRIIVKLNECAASFDVDVGVQHLAPDRGCFAQCLPLDAELFGANGNLLATPVVLRWGIFDGVALNSLDDLYDKVAHRVDLNHDEYEGSW